MTIRVRRAGLALAALSVVSLGPLSASAGSSAGASLAALSDATAPAKDGGDIPSRFAPPTAENDYVKRVEMIPMRDGVRLYTVIIIPKDARNAPIILTRTPYNAAKRAERTPSPSMLALLPLADEGFVRAGYIRVYQDVRGKYGSEGVYEMTRPVRGPLNPTRTDHSTDAWDTIDWLVKTLKQSNGRVGMIGSSYEGFTVTMALLDPHPALKAAVPESPMVDGWMGDDWFHYGAFRQPNFDYLAEQTEQKGAGDAAPRSAYDDFETFLDAGSPAAYARQQGMDQLGWWRKMDAHPAYDAFWSGQALDRLLAQHPSSVPTLWEQGLWDQEDMWGANHAYAALVAAGRADTNWLVMGPWFHSQVNREGFSLGPFRWRGDTALQFREEMVLPFFEHYLRDGPPPDLAHATVYNAVENHWDRFPVWPPSCPSGCGSALTPLYLQEGLSLGFTKPAAGTQADVYISDPAKPVPYLPRPVRFADSDAWRTWLVRDQRFVDGRPDVLSYKTPPLAAPLTIRGAPVADLLAEISGSDVDFVVKLIDVYPPSYPSQPELGGYERPVAMDIFRGRYRASFEHPTATRPGATERYRFVLPNADYVFKPGHRVMVQIQSTLFPLYDRNPQTFTPNPLNAAPTDYRSETIRISRSADAPSAVWLPTVP